MLANPNVLIRGLKWFLLVFWVSLERSFLHAREHKRAAVTVLDVLQKANKLLKIWSFFIVFSEVLWHLLSPCTDRFSYPFSHLSALSARWTINSRDQRRPWHRVITPTPASKVPRAPRIPFQAGQSRGGAPAALAWSGGCALFLLLYLSSHT